MSIRHLLSVVAALALVTSTSLAGALSPELSAQIAAMSGDQLVKVWIKVPQPADHAARLRAAQSASLAEQHRNIIEQLKADQAVSQTGLRSELNSLVSAGKARNVKAHWITTVVEVELPVSELSRLASRADVETIYLAPEITLIAPVDSAEVVAVNPNANSYTSNLRRIRADVAQQAGYTGKGRLVCSFDTGVQGDHPALRTRWRGYNGTSADSAASWYDPVYHSNYPKLILGSLSPNHGTHVMGIMVGWDSTNQNVYGVAPDAKWISAAVIDKTGASILDGFEWAADPDGDPNTISDMPDVINHSWGYEKHWNYDVGCIDLFFDAIDNVEALGIVNIFAAGNTGQYSTPTVGTIFNPANRANDSLDCFAVGNTDTTTSPKLNTTSSRGPSQCGGTHKPNVVAPGSGILSTYPNNTYAYLSGTSMSAPEVSGLVALLRQKNPNATVTQIKQAILTSTNHFSWPIPNDSVGWGYIDCMAALDSLPANTSTVSLRLYNFLHGTVTPGATIAGLPRVLNTGTGSASNVLATITGSNPSLTVLDGISAFGSIAAGTVKTAGDSIKVIVSDTVTVGSVLPIQLTLTATGGYFVNTTLYYQVEPLRARSTATHNTGRIQFTLSNFGVWGMANASFVPLGGAGFTFDGGSNNLFEAGLMATVSPSAVVSGVHGYLYAYDNDFKVSPGGNMQFISPGPLTDQQTRCIFTDSLAFSPIGLRFVQESFSDTAPNDDFIIIRFIVTNLSGVTLTNLRLGLYLDWDLGSGFTNAGGFNLTDSILAMANNTGSDTLPVLSDFRASRILDGPFSSGFTQLGANVYPENGGFTPTEKYLSMTNGTATATLWGSALRELVQVLAAGPIPLSAGQTDTVAFALAAGADYATAADAIFRAKTLYDSVVHGPHSDVPDQPSGLPQSFTLYQNYPNPFNPGTDISFDLPRASDYRLEIFDIMGRRVDEQSGHAAAGRVKLYWDGSRAASGVYLYRVTAGNLVASRKMMLVK